MRPIDQIIQGSALDVLKGLENDSVDCCITSPPYWALRDYKTEGQLGLEPTFNEYLDKLIEIFREVKRVTKGAIWVNIGDTYANNGGATQPHRNHSGPIWSNERSQPSRMAAKLIRPPSTGIPDKSLVGIPERFAIRMTDELGLIRRNTIIWHKPNCMPSSARDRFTVDFEYLYFFTKSPKYYFETQYEPMTEGSHSTGNPGNRIIPIVNNTQQNHIRNPGLRWGDETLGRVKRCVWRISTKPFNGAHFAVFPPDLIETPIKATCPEQICNKCGKGRRLVYEEARINTRPGLDVLKAKSGTELDPNQSLHTSDLSKYRQQIVRNAPIMTTCGCNADFHPGTVLDPFMGAGTTALVAKQLGRSYLGIELNPEYIKLAGERLKSIQKPDSKQKMITDESFLTVKLNSTE